MPKNKLKDELNISLKPKVTEKIEPKQPKNKPEMVDEKTSQSNLGFDAIDRRMRASTSSKATVATTIRLPEDADRALRRACRDFGTSKADMVKSCVEEYLRAKQYLISSQENP